MFRQYTFWVIYVRLPSQMYLTAVPYIDFCISYTKLVMPDLVVNGILGSKGGHAQLVLEAVNHAQDRDIQEESKWVRSAHLFGKAANKHSLGAMYCKCIA